MILLADMNSRRNRIGSNQYKTRKHKHVGYHLLGFIALMDILAFLYLQFIHTPPIISPYVQASEPVSISIPLATKSAELKTEPEYTQEEIESYIRTIFRSDARVAIAVSHNECNPLNKKYPKCQLHTNDENSIGIFQINIESIRRKVHYARIPGDTVEEKKEWLENPYNNTLMAYWIFQTSGWNPWSAYTSGRYLKDM